MPSAATLAVSIRFTASPSFGVDLVLGDAASPLGTGVLSDAASNPVDITFTDTTGAFDPDNGTHADKILPMRQLKVTATYSGTLYTLYSGFIDEWDYSYAPGESAAFVTLVATDAFRILNLTNVTAVAGASAGDLTGKRLGEILDEISWPASSRDFSAGLTTCQADPGTTRDTLSACQTITDTELGAFFTKTNGVLKFMDRNAIVIAHGSSPTVFVDTGAGIYYESIDFDIDDTILANDVTVQRTGGTAQNVSDKTSIASFFLRDLSRTGLLMDTDADALQQAKAILNERKDPELRIGAITIDAYQDTSARVIAALDTELFDPIKVTRTQPGGGTVTRTLSVQGIEHTITPSSWKTTFQTAEKILDGFILDSSTSGVLGTSAISY